MPQTTPKSTKSRRTYRRTGVDRNPKPLKVIVEGIVKVDSLVASADDKVVRPWFDVLHNLKCVWFDLACIKDVPHKVPLGKNDD